MSSRNHRGQMVYTSPGDFKVDDETWIITTEGGKQVWPFNDAAPANNYSAMMRAFRRFGKQYRGRIIMVTMDNDGNVIRRNGGDGMVIKEAK